MPNEDNKILKHKKGTKCIRMEHSIYLDLECILTKHDTCENNPNNLYSKTVSTHEVSGYYLQLVSKHKDIQQLYYRGIDCMERLSSDLMTIGKEIADEEKSEEQLLTQEEENDYEKSKYCYLCETKYSSNEEINNLKKEINDIEDIEEKNRISKRNKFLENLIKIKDYDFYSGEYRGFSHLICSLRYQEQRNIPIIIHNGSNYDFHLIIKELAKKFKSKMKCLGENTETYKTFSVEFEKTNSEKSISYKLFLNILIMLNYVTWIQTVSYLLLKQMIFMKILMMMLINCLILPRLIKK